MPGATMIFAVLVGGAIFGIARTAMIMMRGMALADWVSGERIEAIRSMGGGGFSAVGLRLLGMAGKFQEGFPRIRRASEWLYSSSVKWMGADAPGSALWLAGKEFSAIIAGIFFGWLAGDIVLGSAFGMAAFFAPDLLAKGKWDSAQARIRRELPDTLDLMTLSLEAGLSLDASFAQVAEKLRGGLLPDALARMLGEVRFGMKRHQAWREMARRLGNPEWAEVAEALVQADMMGTGLAEALRGIAGQMRIRSRQRAEEAAHKAPVKLLFPLAFFIFPSIFIVLLGPVFLQLLGVMG